jgi:hypothetical protein
MIPYVITPGKSVTFYANGIPYQAQASAVNLDAVLDELKKPNPNVDHLIALVTPAQAIEAAVEKVADRLPKGVVSVTRSEVRYNGDPIKGVLVERIIWLLSEGFDIMPMVRFLENLFQNPAEFAREELYLWLETSNLPITEDGHFLAYKNVRGDFKSIHDGLTDNTPGTVVSMPREAVDQDRNNTCSQGLHFCSRDYLPHFSNAADGKTVLLKINPADVVSIPSDYNNAKGRAWQYEVLSVVEFDPQTKVWPAVVSETGDDFGDDDFDTDVESDTEEYDMFDVTSDLGKALFARLHEIGITDRDERLSWASEVLDWDVDSFKDLLTAEARTLLSAATEVADEDDVVDESESEDAAERLAKIIEINGLGIIALRRRASRAGFQGAWKGPRAEELRAFLISKV